MIGRGLRTAPDRVAFALALGETGRDPRITTGLAETAVDVTGRGLRTTTDRVNSACDPLLAGEVVMTVCGHAIPQPALMTARGYVRGLLPPLTARDQRRLDGEPDVRSRRVWRQ